MRLIPTHRQRMPYIFHFNGRSVAMGEPAYLNAIDECLTQQGIEHQTTYWDQVYLAQLEDDLAGKPPSLLADSSHMQQMMNSVGVDLDQEEFWSALENSIVQQMSWPDDGKELTMPVIPDWMSKTGVWVFDPVAPPQGPGNVGGWVRVRGREGTGHPVGLFQLTEPGAFWVLGSADDLERVHQLCLELARFREGFDQVTAYLGYDLRVSCLALPITCRATLEEEFYIAGVDTESLFWE